MKIYLVRHGQVPHNALKKYCGCDEDLNETGIKQAQELADKIKNIQYDIIISSPLLRAKHTAKIINNNNRNIIIDERLHERKCGDLSDKPLTCTDRNEYWNYNTAIQYGTSENIKDFINKVFDFLDELKTKNYESVLIVAHSGISKAFSCYFDGIQDGFLLNRGLKNCDLKEYNL